MTETNSHSNGESDTEGAKAHMILVLGQTGSGKSHFINKLAPGSCKESARAASCTQKPSAILTKIDNKEIWLIDTPGFNDTRRDQQRSDAVILDEIAHILAVQSELGAKLRGILYLYDILPARVTGESVRQLEMVKRICGEENFGNVMLVTTRWPDDPTLAQKFNCFVREGDLRREFFRGMIRKGSKMWQFDDQVGTALAIVRALMAKKDVTLALQRELGEVDRLQDTTAGAFVVESRLEDEQRHRMLVQEALTDPAKEEEADKLRANIDQRVVDESKLEGDILRTVRKEIHDLKEEMKQQGTHANVVTLITWLIGMGSLAANVVGCVLGAT